MVGIFFMRIRILNVNPRTSLLGFKQKSVIEFTNAAKIRFLEQFLIGKIQAGL